MFTDTKNLTQNIINASELYSSSSNNNNNAYVHKSKGKFRKVLKPLLRLVTLKSTKSSSSSSSSAAASNLHITHPNNVHLNNASNSKDIIELPTTLLEDYAAVICKVGDRKTATTVAAKVPESALTHHTQHDIITMPATMPAIPTATATTADELVISSASIEKSPATTCNGCSHGRNCQHEQYHTIYDRANHSCAPPFTEMPAIENLADMPVHFIRTDNGTFFWTSAQEKIDDDLLQAWLCQSFLQLPTEASFYRAP